MDQSPPMTFTGYINDSEGEGTFAYIPFINYLRILAQKGGTADVHFSLHHEGLDYEKTFSPKLRINFGKDCYIHEFAPTNEDVSRDRFKSLNKHEQLELALKKPTFTDFVKLENVNYPPAENLIITTLNLQENIRVNSEADFVGDKMITLIVMTSEAIRFQDLQNCVNAVLNGYGTGLKWHNKVSKLVKNWDNHFGRKIPVTCQMVQDLTDEQDGDGIRNYFRKFCG